MLAHGAPRVPVVAGDAIHVDVFVDCVAERIDPGIGSLFRLNEAAARAQAVDDRGCARFGRDRPDRPGLRVDLVRDVLVPKDAVVLHASKKRGKK